MCPRDTLRKRKDSSEVEAPTRAPAFTSPGVRCKTPTRLRRRERRPDWRTSGRSQICSRLTQKGPLLTRPQTGPRTKSVLGKLPSYLTLLQRKVDSRPSPVSSSSEGLPENRSLFLPHPSPRIGDPVVARTYCSSRLLGR